MKLATENLPTLQQCQIHVPFGLIGLNDLQRFDLSHIDGSWPFMSMKCCTNDDFSFIVMEPQGVIPEYEIELSDEDADCLQINCADDALVLNIVTIHSSSPLFVTVNLVGPLIVNRQTLIGKQVIIARSSDYSTRHPIIDECNQEDAA
jgi:flagellar assembly factor FliW